jgi:CTP synthase
MVENLRHPEKETVIAIVGKYTQLHDAYLSVAESLKHGAIANNAKVNIRWVDSEEVEKEGAATLLKGVNGILVPGGFGQRGIEGMIMAVQYARENKIPYLGICLGMQISIIEFARNVLGWKDANSTEFKPETTHPVIDLMPEQKTVTDLGGTMRLGSYPCELRAGSKPERLYGTTSITERHRHRYEVNNDYREDLESAGMMLVGQSPDGHIVEMIELKDHPYFIAAQAHPEFKSRPNKAHPLFRGLIEAALKNQENI